MSTYRAVQVSGAGTGDWALVERELTDPLPGQVRLRVEACGICHTDALAVGGVMRPDPSVPIVPGHEVVGVIDAVGAGVTRWHVGDRVGVGFLNGHCGECDFCRRGDFVNCADQPVTGTSVDGGYAEVAYARASGLVRIPDGMAPADAAPLLCAGLTVYQGLRQAGAGPGALVAVFGIGGLGHLGLQYADKLGYRTVAIARGTDRAELAARLGARHYIDATAEDPAEALRGLGGAAAIIATVPDGRAMSPLVTGLAPHGRLVVLGAGMEAMSVLPGDLLFGQRSIVGSLVGTPIENEDNLAFVREHGIASMNEVMPLSEAPKAFERMMSGKARFRVVLDARA
ncbi:alcohol dehydrogenase catalytic domain-containing protein [Sphaerisporangium sp. NPDC005289]|uniref:alcohol dehydrogenase catalytic domain-containing protein n=1 Tax=Sphaerisporangium sp. NPDC005289 TaxID=3155247 RepID=UPI0033B9822E